MKQQRAAILRPEELPTKWYNIQPDLPEPLPPPRGDAQLKALPDLMIGECLKQEFSPERWIDIPYELQQIYIQAGRPRPLYRALNLEKALGTPARMYYKSEFYSPTGSHKVNTALAQCFYAREAGFERLTTETGAGQWGTALAYGCSLMGLKCSVYWVRAVYRWKHERRNLMQMYGAEVFASPSNRTEAGRVLYSKNPDHPGSLAIAISEGLEAARGDKKVAYSLGSVLNHVLMHQTIIGLETQKQFEMMGDYPDLVISCLGGGSNFGGFALPFVGDVLTKGKKIKFIAAQSQSAPNLQGVYRYDHADHAEITPELKMYTLGHKTDFPPIMGDGLRYHGCSPIISLLRDKGYIDTVAYPADEKHVFETTLRFLRAEGFLPAPESAYSVACAIDEAMKCKKTGEEKVIAFNISGHGFLDIIGYSEVLGLSVTGIGQMEFPAEPFRIKVVERIRQTTHDERELLLKHAGLNVFNLPSEAIFVDLLTDSGTSAMSDRQWGGLMVGDEAYAGSRSFFRLEAAVRDITGFPIVIPTHQGRVAENLLFSTICKPGLVVINNTHFDTTRANVEANAAQAKDLPVSEALRPEHEFPFKGNMDTAALDRFLAEHPGVCPMVVMTVTNNSAGGQPVSMQNIRETSQICKRHSVPFFFDCARYAENCWFIRQREPGYQGKKILDIAREMFSYADGCWMSAKKDALVNIGGFIALKDGMLAQTIKNNLILIEGFPTYGGLAGRDLEAVATGLYEGLDEDYLQYRTAQVQYLGERLIKAGVPIVRPVGGHAVFIDAASFAPHIPPAQFPGVALTVALYREAGIRGVEIGSLMFGDAAPLELVRLAIPRRVYTTSHMSYVAKSIVRIYENRDRLRGLRLTYEAPVLRHFTARFEEI